MTTLTKDDVEDICEAQIAEQQLKCLADSRSTVKWVVGVSLAIIISIAGWGIAREVKDAVQGKELEQQATAISEIKIQREKDLTAIQDEMKALKHQNDQMLKIVLEIQREVKK